jgi:hypothetical protein
MPKISWESHKLAIWSGRRKNGCDFLLQGQWRRYQIWQHWFILEILLYLVAPDAGNMCWDICPLILSFTQFSGENIDGKTWTCHKIYRFFPLLYPAKCTVPVLYSRGRKILPVYFIAKLIVCLKEGFWILNESIARFSTLCFLDNTTIGSSDSQAEVVSNMDSYSQRYSITNYSVESILSLS